MVDPAILIVEHDRAKLAGAPVGTATVIIADVVDVLAESAELNDGDVVLPMVPFHLVASYLLRIVPGLRRASLPDGLDLLVPNPFRVDDSTLCCSRADFICPDDCLEGEKCMVTGLPRRPLYADLECLEIPGYSVFVQRSSQILPGIGGYRWGGVAKIPAHLAAGKHLIVTSCKCHAIMTAVERGDRNLIFHFPTAVTD